MSSFPGMRKFSQNIRRVSIVRGVRAFLMIPIKLERMKSRRKELGLLELEQVKHANVPLTFSLLYVMHIEKEMNKINVFGLQT
ncbi:13676_t:CDS:2 [Entrophospora sp. SA101]|nr:13676_t:CDS:2 [Entrophospora sp. SA101]